VGELEPLAQVLAVPGRPAQHGAEILHLSSGPAAFRRADYL